MVVGRMEACIDMSVSYPYKSSDLSTAVYNSLCSIVRDRQDLDRANHSPKRMAYEDYMRSLQHYHQTNLPSSYDPRLYLVDKVVRKRLSEGSKFGFDNSEVLRLEMDPTVDLDTMDGRMLTDRLSAPSRGDKGAPLSYEDWKERKDAEERLKTKLVRGIQMEDQEVVRRKAAEEQREKAEKEQRVAKWEADKRKEETTRKTESRKRAEKAALEAEEKQAKSALAYQSWLQANLKQLQVQKQAAVDRRAKSQQKAMADQQREDDRKKVIEMRYQEWLQSKLKKRPASKPTTPRYHVKRPIMLAYSPNRRIPASSPSPSTSSQPTLRSSFIPEETEETPESSLHELPVVVQEERHQRIFDELSSIQRTSHFLGNQASGDSEEEFGERGESGEMGSSIE